MGMHAGLFGASHSICRMIGNVAVAAFHAHRVNNIVYQPLVHRVNLFDNTIYCYHPSAHLDLQSLLALPPIFPAHIPVLSENQYINNIHYGQDPNTINYKVFMFLPHEDNPVLPLRPSLSSN